MTIRVTRADWIALNRLVGYEKIEGNPAASLQTVVINALNAELTRRGMPPLETRTFGRGGKRR